MTKPQTLLIPYSLSHQSWEFSAERRVLLPAPRIARETPELLLNHVEVLGFRVFGLWVIRKAFPYGPSVLPKNPGMKAPIFPNSSDVQNKLEEIFKGV